MGHIVFISNAGSLWETFAQPRIAKNHSLVKSCF